MNMTASSGGYLQRHLMKKSMGYYKTKQDIDENEKAAQQEMKEVSLALLE